VPSNLYERKPDGSVRARATLHGIQTDLGRHPNDEAAYAAIREAKATRTLPKEKTITVAAWDELWMRLYPGKRNEETSAHVKLMCTPFVREHGGLRLSDITPLMAQAWAVENPSHVRFLRQMFEKACKAGLLGLNVWAHVEVERVSAPRVPPTPAQLERLLGAARARGGWWSHFAECMTFTAYCGARGEEVERVQVADVLAAGSRVVLRGKRRAGEVEPRVRTVAVFGPGREALVSQLPEVGRVWRATQGGPLTQRVRETQFRVLRREIGAEHLTFHGLRHFCASWLLDQGASKQDVAIQLGHRDAHGRVDTTQVERVYGHLTVEPALQRLEAVTTEGVPGVHGDAVRGAGAHLQAEA
jgi:integrase